MRREELKFQQCITREDVKQVFQKNASDNWTFGWTRIELSGIYYYAFLEQDWQIYATIYSSFFDPSSGQGQRLNSTLGSFPTLLLPSENGTYSNRKGAIGSAMTAEKQTLSLHSQSKMRALPVQCVLLVLCCVRGNKTPCHSSLWSWPLGAGVEGTTRDPYKPQWFCECK